MKKTARAINKEIKRQNVKWGEQNHPDGTGEKIKVSLCEAYRTICDKEFAAGKGNWMLILREEVYEAFAETDPEKLKTELIQVAAVCQQWIACIERRQKNDNKTTRSE